MMSSARESVAGKFADGGKNGRLGGSRNNRLDLQLRFALGPLNLLEYPIVGQQGFMTIALGVMKSDAYNGGSTNGPKL